MGLLVTVARWELILLGTAFAALAGWKLWQSGSFAGLLRSADGTFSPGRVQLLVLTVGTAMQYILATIHDPSRLPAIPMALVMALGGSHTVYLGAKAWNLFGNKQNGSEDK